MGGFRAATPFPGWEAANFEYTGGREAERGRHVNFRDKAIGGMF
jgi:hypothetical protein